MLWLCVEADEYELPLAVCDTRRELAEKCGVSEQTVKSAIYRNNSGERLGIRYIKVEE